MVHYQNHFSTLITINAVHSSRVVAITSRYSQPLPQCAATEAVYQKRACDPYWRKEHDLACHGFNIIAVGMGLRWKSFVAYHFTDTSFDPDITAQWIIQVIRRLMDIGLKVRFQTFDSSTMNVAL